MDLKNRLFGAGHIIFTAIGAAAGFLVSLGQYLALIPPEYRSNKWYGVAAALVALGAAIKMPSKGDPAALPPKALLALLVGGALLAAAPARADDPVPPGLIPSAGICNTKGSVCVSPAFAVVPYAIDLRSGNVSRDIAFAFGYGVTFPEALTPTLIPGVDLLGGLQTGGGWMAGLLPRVGPVRVGILLTHKPGATYAQFGLGGGY